MPRSTPLVPDHPGAPDPQVAALDAAARHHTTPCEAGVLQWRVFGEGRPLVLAHGGFGSWTHWLRNIPHLARTRRVLVPDLPGHGQSDTPSEPHSAGQFGAILAAGITALLDEGEVFDLVGFSFGAVISGQAACLLGGRVRQFVLVGAGGLALPSPPRRSLITWRQLEGEAARRDAHRHNLSALMLHDPEAIDDRVVDLQVVNAGAGRVRTYAISATGALRACLPQVRAPLAGIWGEHDVTARGYLDQRRDLLRSLDPGAPFHVIAGAGHWVQFERAEAFNACLDQVLARIP